jgi:hypothetical protein
MNTSFLVLILMLNPKRIRWRVIMILCCRAVGFLSAHVYLMFKGVFWQSPLLIEWNAKEEERRKLGRKGWSSLQLLWRIWSTVCIWILCFQFFGHTNFERWVFVCQQPQVVCLQTLNMSSGYKLQHNSTLKTELFSKCSLHMIMWVYVMITDWLID